MNVTDQRFEELCEQWKPKISKVIRQWRGLIPGFDDEDVEQEVLGTMWKCALAYDSDHVNQETGQKDGASFHTLFHLSVHRRLMNVRSSVQIHNSMVERDRKTPIGHVSTEQCKALLEHGNPERGSFERRVTEVLSVAGPEPSVRVELEMAGLTRNEVNVLVGRGDGLTYTETGAMYGLDKGEVKALTDQARQKIQSVWGGEE